MSASQEPARSDLARRRFIFRRGVLGFGLSTGVLWAAAMAWHGPGPFWAYLLVALAGFPLGGWLWGAILWRLTRAGRQETSGSEER